MTRVFIMGAGRVGRGLAGALRASGVEIVGLHGRRPGDGISAGVLPGTVDQADVVIVAVRDPQLEGALLEIAAPERESEPGADAVPATPGRKRAHRSVVLHASGSSTPRALDDLRALGHSAGTFHPLIPIAEPAHAGERLRGAWIGVDGDPAAIEAARALATRLGASALEIPVGAKPRYHAAAVFASNFPAVLAAIAAQLMQQTGVGMVDARSAVNALLRASVANLHEGDPATVLTGPIVRGDLVTVRAHLVALESDDLVSSVYQSLSLAAIRLLSADPSADRQRLAEIEDALNQRDR